MERLQSKVGGEGMVEMLMRRRSLFMASGGMRPEPPDDGWELLESFTTNTTWTAPWDGWFRISCVGSGGAGGDGGAGFSKSDYPSGKNNVSGSGGGGGGSGGFASSVFYLSKGNKLTVSYNGNATVSGNVNGEKISILSTAGQIGDNGAKGSIRYAAEYDPPRYIVNAPKGGTGGTAGTASGGNKINANGKDGGTGTNGAGNQASSPGGGPGGDAAIPIFSSIPKGSGSGGDGGGGGYYNRTLKPPTSGGSASSGGVFIEKEKGRTS